MSEEIYGVSAVPSARKVAAPDLPYRPPIPREPARLPIGLIGCGGITQSHLAAYRAAGFCVKAIASRSLERAEARRAEFFPEAKIFTDWRDLLACDEIRVVDIATHVAVRAPIIEAALHAGKHVLSQKPFALSVAEGERLVAIAEARGLRLAVNQNGRWAPHFSWMREAVVAGLVGEISSVDFAVHWDHHWICGTPFDAIPEVILGDFAIHWFDLVNAFLHDRPVRRVYAAATRSRSQRAQPPFIAHACVEYENAQATLVFNADTGFGHEDRTTIIGSRGTLRSVGPGLLEQTVTLSTEAGAASPTLEGNWFREGFIGTMGELLCAVEEGRVPRNGARENIRSLALCFAAMRSAEQGSVVELA